MIKFPSPLSHHLYRSPSNRGFAYLSLLIVIAIIGVSAAATLQLGSILQRRAAEEELLAIGSEFRRALISYSSATPAGQPSVPPTLQALLKDPRYPNIRRHLRKLYFDPLTGNQQWGTVMSIDGKGIVGIYSLSTAKPIKIGNFETPFLSFTDKTSYADWVFMAVMAVVANPAATTTKTVGNTDNPVNTSNSAPIPGGSLLK
ncbi:MAG: type II secretion system protein [Burkholderiales bacterium]